MPLRPAWLAAPGTQAKVRHAPHGARSRVCACVGHPPLQELGAAAEQLRGEAAEAAARAAAAEARARQAQAHADSERAAAARAAAARVADLEAQLAASQAELVASKVEQGALTRRRLTLATRPPAPLAAPRATRPQRRCRAAALPRSSFPAPP